MLEYQICIVLARAYFGDGGTFVPRNKGSQDSRNLEGEGFFNYTPLQPWPPYPHLTESPYPRRKNPFRTVAYLHKMLGVEHGALRIDTKEISWLTCPHSR